MREEGMCEITNPSDILISEREDNPAGSCIVSCMEGTRPILVELQCFDFSNYIWISKKDSKWYRL